MAARRTKAPSDPTLETPDTADTERPPPLSDGQLQHLALVDELIARMVRNGVRRVAVSDQFGATVDVELDPSAQYLPANGGDSAEPSEPARAKPPGECIVPSCDKKGGHLRQPYCRDHFQSELRNPRRNR